MGLTCGEASFFKGADLELLRKAGYRNQKVRSNDTHFYHRNEVAAFAQLHTLLDAYQRKAHLRDHANIDRFHTLPLVTGDGFRMLADYFVDDDGMWSLAPSLLR